MRLSAVSSVCLVVAMSVRAFGSDAMQVLALDGLTISIPADWERMPEPATLLTARRSRPSAGETFLTNIRLKRYNLTSSAGVAAIVEVQAKQAVREGFRVDGQGTLTQGEQQIGWLAITKPTTTQ